METAAVGKAGGRHARDGAADFVPRGILFMIAATLFLAVSNALAKWLVATYPVGEVMFIRSFSSLAACSLFVLPVTGLAVFTTQRKREHIGRGLSQSISQTFTVIALSLMPLAGATAIGFSAPLWGALLSIVWLKERAGVVRWSVLLCGFFGVLIVTNPGTDSLQIGALFALANAIMYGSVTVAVRGMTKTESANTLLMWQMATMATVHVFLLFFGMISAVSLRRASADRWRCGKRDRPVFLDASAATRAGHGGLAILLFPVGLGADHWLLGVGRHPDAGIDLRLDRRRGIRFVSALARSPAARTRR